MNTSKNYKQTLAQQQDLNWDGNPALDVEVEHWIEEKQEDLEEEAVVRWFYD